MSAGAPAAPAGASPARTADRRLRVATDIGGTFTDLVWIDEQTGELGISKASTTPHDLAQGVLDTVAGAGVSLAAVSEFVHGTTVVINALTERNGARTALVTTAGFRDVLEIGRGNRPDMYNLVSRKPEPFVPRRHRFEVRERVDRHGTVLTPLQLDDVAPVAEACRAAGIEAVAVCFLHGYAHPAHERAVGARLAELLPGVPVTLSSDVTREWREYERSSTAVLNAYVQPRVERYLDELQQRLAAGGLARPLHLMQSSAGTASLAAARARPITMVESGPAGGIVGAARIGVRIGEPNVIYLDIGGTTAKCSLILDGQVATTTEYRIDWRPDFAGYPVMVPVVDIVEIGAGGGSIAWVDAGGSIRVGPQSAGADPGPACYERGGTRPTVTDAKLVAGVLDAEYFLGGALTVSRAAAERALAELGAPLGLSPAALANGIIRLVNANMINALKLVSVRRGHDPRDFVLVVGGGGGAMHAAALGAELQVRAVVVPPHSGVFSAWGMSMTAPRFDVVQTRIARLGATGATAADLTALFEALEAEAAAAVVDEGIAPRVVACERAADMRYVGQEHAVRVPVAPGPGPVDLAAIERDFHAAHLQKYTFELQGDPVEIVTYHVTAFGPAPAEPASAAAPDPAGAPSPSAVPQPKSRRPVDFDVDGVHDTPVYERSALTPGAVLAGPLVVEEPTTTTLVHPGQTLTADAFGNLVIRF